MVITDATISQDVYTTVRTILVGVNPYVTNSSTNATTLASINATYNDKASVKPQIVISPAKINETNWKFSSNEGKKLINIPIDCYYSTGLGAAQLSDQICSAIKTAGTALAGMELVAITTDADYIEVDENKYHLKAHVFTFDRE